MIKLDIDLSTSTKCTIVGALNKTKPEEFVGETLASIDKLCECFENQTKDLYGYDNIMLFYLAAYDVLVQRVHELVDRKTDDMRKKQAEEKAKVEAKQKSKKLEDVLKLDKYDDDTKQLFLEELQKIVNKYKK